MIKNCLHKIVQFTYRIQMKRWYTLFHSECSMSLVQGGEDFVFDCLVCKGFALEAGQTQSVAKVVQLLVYIRPLRDENNVS